MNQKDIKKLTKEQAFKDLEKLKSHLSKHTTEIDCTYKLNEETNFLNEIQRICSEAEQAVRSGSQHLIITDNNINKERIALPMILATSAVHSYLIKNNLRTFTSLNVSSRAVSYTHLRAHETP